MPVDSIAIIVSVLAVLLNIVSLVGVFTKLENRLTKLETTQAILLKLIDRRHLDRES